jgi:hypothetical protein
MTTQVPAPRSDVALVPGELRGYRQFELRADGLYPLAHSGSGAWTGTLERATCSFGTHPPPAVDCRCGLYGWYLPGSATVPVGPVSAVIAARGRCVLGDRGFRAAEARIEAVALPVAVRWNPRAAARVRRMLAARYPGTRVYGSLRQMWRDHPPHDVRELGVHPQADRSRRYRAAAVATYVTGLMFLIALATLPRLVAAHGSRNWWPLFVVFFAVAWQAALVCLVARLLRLQMPDSAGGKSRAR